MLPEYFNNYFIQLETIVSMNYYLTVVETFVCLHDLYSCTGWR